MRKTTHTSVSPAYQASHPLHVRHGGQIHSGQRMINRESFKSKLATYPRWMPSQSSFGLPQQTTPYYMKFASGATLWDRGVYHCAHNHRRERPTPLCPRFIAHMTTSADTPGYSIMHSNKSVYYPGRRNYYQYGKVFTTTNKLNSTDYTLGRQRQTTQIKLPGRSGIYASRQRVPSVASSKVTDTDAVCEEVSIIQNNIMVHLPNIIKEDNTISIELAVGADEKISKVDGDEEHKDDSEIPVNGLKFSKTSEDENSVCSDGNGEDSDLSGRVSCCSTLYRSCSTSLSQLRSSSSFSISIGGSCKSSEAFKTFSNKTTEHRNLLISGSGHSNNILNMTKNDCAFHSNTELLFSLCPIRKCTEDLEPATSFVEVWHDHLLHHWPVLPPISPERAFSDPCSVEDGRQSQMSIFSSDSQDAFDELEMVDPHTGSMKSVENQDMSDREFSSSSSGICRKYESLNFGCHNSNEESLADVRLSLLNHTDFGQEDTLEEPDNLWDSNISLNKDPWLLPAPASLSVTDTSNTSNKGRDDQKNINTVLSTMGDMNLGSQEEFFHQVDFSLQSPRTDSLELALSDSHTVVLSQELCSDETTGQNGSDVCTTNGLETCDVQMPKSVRNTYKQEDSCHVKSNKKEDAEHLPPRQLEKLDLSIRQEMERQRIAEQRRSQAVHIYSKLRSTRATNIRATQPISISKFEDFDFLAKYCIFSQEKLAEYKRAFEAVDSDQDGYLDCLQVLMALKEIVPPHVLSDAEELYVYRILEIVDYYVTDGLTDLRLFAVMASLAQKIAALEFSCFWPKKLIEREKLLNRESSFMRSLIDHMDFKALELKMYKAKQLFLCNIDEESKIINVDQLLVELKAGGISQEHEEAAQLQLRQIKKLDILDFLTYLPLFVHIHNSVISNPLDDSRTI